MGQVIEYLILNGPFGAANAVIFPLLFIALFFVLGCCLVGVILGLWDFFWWEVLRPLVKFLVCLPFRIIRAVGLWTRKCLYKKPLADSDVANVPDSPPMELEVQQEPLQEQSQQEQQVQQTRKEYLLDESLMEKLINFEYSRSPKMRH